VLLYELATGVLPFSAEDAFAVITQHLHAPVVPPRARNPAIPPALNNLILQLLSKDVRDRPVSAAEVLRVLDRMEVAEQPAAPLPEPDEDLSVLDRIVRGRLIGREQELADARNLWRKAVSGEGQLLLISGEPGIGKSRFMQELVTRAEVAGATALVGECYAEGGAPYAPFAQAIRETLGNGASGDLDLPEYVLADLLTLTPDLRARYADVTPNPPLDPQAEQLRLFENVVTFWDLLSAGSPLLFVMEDAHWADEASLSLLRHLARRTRERPTMIMATYREVELDEALPFQEVLLDLNRERLATRIKLGRLDRQATQDMLAALFAEEITPEFLEGIYQETEGNPFFVEEVVKALVRSGELYFADGVWHRPSMGELQIPQSVRVAIQSRVGRLPAEVQDLLSMAAILGREFDFETLREASGLDEDEMIDGLEQAERAQLVEEVSSERGGTFWFVHALIPSTLLEGLSGLRRRRRRRQAAEAIERLRPDDLEALAYQYSRAEAEEKALCYLRAAGDRARHLYANEDALRFYSQALEFADQDAAATFELLSARAQVYDVVARREEQLADVESMLVLAEGLEDAQRFDAQLALTDYYLVTDLYHSLEAAERALEMARALDDPLREALALRRLGEGALRRYNLPTARQALEQAAALFRELDRLNDVAITLRDLASALRQLNDFAAAQRAAEEALQLSRSVGDRRGEALALGAVASVHSAQSRPEEALPLDEESLAISREIGDIAGECGTLNSIGINFGHLGDFERQETCYRQALEIAEAISLSAMIQKLENNLVLSVYRPRAGYEEALLFLREMEVKARERSAEFLLVVNAYTQAFILGRMGRYEEAVAMLEARLPRVERTISSGALQSTRAALGLLYTVLGHSADARRAIEAVELEPDEASSFGFFAHEWLARAGLANGAKENLIGGLDHAEQAIALNTSGHALDDLANALGVRALLYLALFDLDADRQHLEQALASSREAIRISEGTVGATLFDEYHYAHSRALRGLGREDEADEHLRQAYEWVMLVAEKTQDETLRRSWLENVALNQQILAEAEERGISALA
jgi:tetratricopeptide (TPR) repeat protein